MKVQHKESGFTLLEVVVALGILTVGVSAAISLFAAGTASHRRAVDRIRAIEVSEVVLSALEGTIRDGATVTDLIQNPPWQPLISRWPGISVEVRYGTVPKVDFTDELLVEIHVQWISRGLDSEEVFRQIVPRMRSIRLDAP
ncbi:MAG: type II secretion system protein [Planctomycetota bacterium]|nr:type II secretion system protein [Planctomycetota bacterium]